MPEVAQATILVTPVMKGAQQTITNELTGAAGPAGTAAGKVVGNNLGKGMSSAGKKMTAGVTVPLAAIGTAAVASWKEVDAGLDTIVEKTGASGESLEEMRGVLSNITSSIPTDFETAGAAIGEVNTRFGLTGQELESLSGQFVKFAQLNDQDVSTSVDSVSKMLAAFGMDASDAGAMLDALNVVGQQTGVDVGSLSDMVAANAKQFQEMGLSAEDAASFLGSASMAGLDTNTAMMGLKTAMKNATEEGMTLDEALGGFQETMNSNASESDKLAAAYELFGTRAGGAIENAVENGELDLQDFTGSLGEFEGSVDETFEGTLSPMEEFQTTLNDLKQAGADIVEAAGPALADFLGQISEIVKDLADAWNGLSPEMQQFIIKAMGIAAVAGPILAIGGKILGGVGKLAGGIGGLVGKIGGLGGAASTAAGPVATAGGSFSTMAGGALQLVAVGASIWLIAQAISTLADAAIRIAEAGWPAAAVLAGMGAGIVGLMAAAAALGPAMTVGAIGIGVFGAAMLGIGAGIKLACDGISKVIDAIGDLVEVIADNAPEINSIVTNLGDTISGVIKTISDGISDIVGAVGDAVSGVLDSLAGVFDSIGDAALNAGTGFEKLVGALKDLVTDTKLGDLAGTLIAASKGVKSLSKAAKGAGEGADNMSKMGSAFTAIATGTGSAVSSMSMLKTSVKVTTAAIKKDFAGLKLDSYIKKAFADATSAARTGLNSLKTAMLSVKFSLNHNIAVPHWSLVGSFDAKAGKVPEVKTRWYRVAETTPFLFDRATLFGAGEGRDEVLYGRSALMRDIEEAAGRRGVVINNSITVNGAEDPEEYADRFVRRLNMQLRTV